MTGSAFIALLPFLVIAVDSLILLLMISFCRNHLSALIVTLLGFALGFMTLPVAYTEAPRQIQVLFIMDGFAIFFIGLILTASIIITLLLYSYLIKVKGRYEEIYVLLLTATLGSMVLVISRHFVSFFLGLETLTVSLYVLIAYFRESELNLEAGIKYLILAAVSSAFLLFGMALVYADLGTMEIDEIVSMLADGGYSTDVFLMMGLGMMLIGVGFKLALVPLHLWTPDIYQGAVVPITTYVATVSKGGMFALLLRYFSQLDMAEYNSVYALIAFLAIASMVVGNLLALLQNNVKRILAYSSIAHFGYLLVGVLSGSSIAITASSYYLLAYFVTILAAFSIVTIFSGKDKEAENIEDYHALFWRRPWLAVVFAAALFSLAGIPLTGGFIGKFYIVAAGVESNLWLPVITLIVTSVIGLFYYLRIVVTMLKALPEQETAIPQPTLSTTSGISLIITTITLIWLGIYPTPFISLIQSLVRFVI